MLSISRAIIMAGYKPTEGMKIEAQRALDWVDEGRRGGTRIGKIRARQIVAGENLSYDTVIRMYSFFARHEVDKKAEGFEPDEKGYPSAGRVAWGLWGGDAGYTWSKNIRDNEQAKQNKGIQMSNIIHREFNLIKRNGEDYEMEGMEPKDDGIWSFTISTPDVDRYGTIIVPSGIDYSAYMNNPVVLINHKSDYLPIGKCLGFFLNGENLEATIQLDMNDEKAIKVNDKIKNGFVSAVSVGIIPIEQTEQNIDGEKVTTYTKSELVEFSVVTIPANRDALIKKTFENQQQKTYKQILKQIGIKRMLTPEQVVAIEDQLLPVIKEAALLFLKEELAIDEELATQAAEEGTVAMAEKVMAILNPDATAEVEPQVEPAPAVAQPTETVEASFETRAGKKISATTMAMIMEGVGMINEGNKKITKAINTERGFSIATIKKLNADEILESIKGNK
ncbi:MAG: HK97 family phage prohead protease [Ignavibacteriae bacterium]|nr:HK97 family phage prohead protease [Ignavibacteriota bacterium]